MIVFVGDKPSSKNIDPNIAFVGTPSYKVLLNWIAELKLSINDVMIYNKDSEELQKTFGCANVIYVALGNNAAKRMDLSGWPYFKLPHPSPKNRKLNDKKYIKEQLIKCDEYITIMLNE